MVVRMREKVCPGPIVEAPSQLRIPFETILFVKGNRVVKCG